MKFEVVTIKNMALAGSQIQVFQDGSQQGLKYCIVRRLVLYYQHVRLKEAVGPPLYLEMVK